MMTVVIDFALVSLGGGIGFAVAALFASNKNCCNCGASQFQAPQCGEPSGKPETAEGSPPVFPVK